MPCTLRHAQHSGTPSPYPYKWLWTYGGDKFLKPKAHKKIHRRRGTTYYYLAWREHGRRRREDGQAMVRDYPLWLG